MENTTTILKIVKVVGVTLLLEHRLITNVACVFLLILRSPLFLSGFLFFFEHLSE